MRSRFADVRGEKALGLFLDRYFYPTLAKEFGFDKAGIKRIYDKARQVVGIDLTLPLNGEMENIDEKGAVRYIGETLTTFSFEIDFYSDKEDVKKYVDGWFISSSNLTDYYLIMWINRANCDKEKIGRIMAEDFEEVDACLIKKEDVRNYADDAILKYASQNGFEKETGAYEVYKALAKQLRQEYKKKHKTEEQISEDNRLMYSPALSEEPVNLLINRRRLAELSFRRYIITKEKVQRIK